MAATASGMIAHINAGKLRGIGIASAQRFPALPDVPTYIEGGFTGFTAASWVGFFMPSRTDSALVAKLNAAINEALKEPAVHERLQRFGQQPMIADTVATKRFFEDEIDHWGKMVRAIGVSIN
jgi:tripartite-type tricarboxylate transporter receptor subunit TctC